MMLTIRMTMTRICHFHSTDELHGS